MRDEELKLEKAVDQLVKSAMPKKDDPNYIHEKIKVLQAQLAVYQYLAVVEDVLVVVKKNVDVIDSLKESIDSAAFSKLFGITITLQAIAERLKKER